MSWSSSHISGMFCKKNRSHLKKKYSNDFVNKVRQKKHFLTIWEGKRHDPSPLTRLRRFKSVFSTPKAQTFTFDDYYEILCLCMIYTSLAPPPKLKSSRTYAPLPPPPEPRLPLRKSTHVNCQFIYGLFSGPLRLWHFVQNIV